MNKIVGWIPFVLIAFINAFVDLGHKVIIQNTIFKAYDGNEQVIYAGIINALILIPFILMFSTAGYFSDRYEKRNVMKVAALSAIGITSAITFCYYQGFFEIAFGLTLLLAFQSALYSPSKYGYIKELVGKNNLSTANGVVQATTTIAILSGIAVFSYFFESMFGNTKITSEMIYNVRYLGWVLIGCSVFEALLAFRLPKTEEGNKNINFKISKLIRFGYMKENLTVIYSSKIIWLSIIGLSVFWGISQVLLAVFPSYVKETLAVDNVMIVQGILALSGLGIMLGSVVSSRLSKNYIETGIVPFGAIGVCASIITMPFIDSLSIFAILFFTLGFFGAIFIIPLNALIQFHSKKNEAGIVLAGNNFIQNIFMLSFLAITIAIAYLDTPTIYVFYGLIVVSVIGCVYTLIKLPQAFVRLSIAIMFKRNYKLNVMGFKNIPESGGVLLLANHVSFIDWAIIQMSCPRQVNFVMEKTIYSKWYLKWFLDLFGVIPISKGDSKGSLESIAMKLDEGKVVCLFPEGAISRNGQLGQFKKGFEKAAEQTKEKAVIIPLYLRGLWGSSFSRSNNKVKENRKTSSKRSVIVSYGKPMDIKSTHNEVKQKVFELSFSSWEEYTDSLESVHMSWLSQASKQKGNSVIDYLSKTELTHNKLLASTLIFSKKIKKITKKEKNIGILLPSSSACVVTNMSVLMTGKTIVNINYTSAMESVKKSLESAEIKTIFTSRKFIDKLSKRGINVESIFSERNVIYLEDLGKEITPKQKILSFIKAKFLPTFMLRAFYFKKVSLDSPAAILFSSGSEGTPKGVVLSHKNIVANSKQISDVLNSSKDDVILNSLPTFHAFGLTVTTLMPLIEGIPQVCIADPTDAVSVGKSIARYNVSILCATSTFLRLYAINRRVSPLMLDSLRIVVGGAEKINEDVRKLFESKFRKQIFEGYGATETTPVASVNLPDHLDKKFWTEQKGYKNGTVGLPLPGTSFKIVDPSTMKELPSEQAGLILIGGCQLMTGYLNDQAKTDEVIVEIEGSRWYKSGDKGYLDSDGFLVIIDRYSRFAKIAGEMISLGAVEEKTSKLITVDNFDLVTVNIPDEKKGEKVIMLFTGDLKKEDLKKILISSDLPKIMIPDDFIKIDEIPKLGSGKTDFNTAKKIVLDS
jgi:acyl-[acyl-carrier-protein]-phospholipid O-acyltransferase/long-chain-fatty-acid--[acyl-carrier-protein] ligase